MKIEEYGAKIAFQIKTKKPELDRIEYCVKQKNNGFERPAVIVGSTTEKVAMFIYIDEYFNKSLEPDIVAEIAIQEYAKGYKPELDVQDFEQVRDKICYQLVNKERNTGYPSIDAFGDLAIMYYVQLKEAHCLITSSLLEQWGITKEQVHKLALKNTQRINKPVIRSITDVLFDILDETDSLPMYVLTNESGTFGATTITYEGILADAHKKLGDFYIVPSSIHEMLLVPIDTAEPMDLQSMLQEVNCTLQPDDYLSDTLYHYDGSALTPARTIQLNISR